MPETLLRAFSATFTMSLVLKGSSLETSRTLVKLSVTEGAEAITLGGGDEGKAP